jgi:hypothetical protein
MIAYQRKLSLFVQTFVLCVVFLSIATHAHAQVINTGAGISISASPSFPKPNTPVTLKLIDYSTNTVGAGVEWYVNGVRNESMQNERTIVVESGAIGEKKDVEVRVTPSGGIPMSARYTITSTVIDVIVEAETYTPSFYKGRALPSPESTLRAIAVIHDGSSRTPQDYAYKWELDGNIIETGALTGKNVMTIPTRRFQTGNLRLEVFDRSGVSVGATSVKIGITQPQMHLYEFSPLRGLSQRVVKSPATIIGEETTLYAEPYFMNIQSIATDTNFEWLLNKTVVTQNVTTPNTIVLRRVGEGGQADVVVSAFSKSKLPQYAKGSLRVVFE